MKLIRLSLVVLLVALASLGLWSAVLAQSEQIGYTTGDDGNTSIYGAIWEGQTFMSSNTTAYSISSIRIKAFRTGTPGTITASIRSTSEGNITGSDLTSGTTDGDTITNSSPGEWVSISLSPAVYLIPDTQYGIVIRATAGDAANFINWRLDSSSPAYTGGNRTSSADSGVGWTIDSTDDFMFALYGESTFEILDAQVYASVFEPGDRYIVMHYNCMVAPGYPGQDPNAYFDITLFQGATDIAKIPLPAWGYKTAAIYLSANSASALTWGSGSAGLALTATDNSIEDTYVFDPADWIGLEIFELDSWVRTTAQEIEDFYNVDILWEQIPTSEGNLTLPSDESVLSPLGCTIFQDGMYGLDELRPHLFYMLTHSPEEPDTAWTYEYDSTLDWEARLGTAAAADMETAASTFNIDGKTLASVLFFAGYITIVGVGVWRTGQPAIATGAAIPFLAGGMWMDLIALAVGAIATFIAIVLTMWIVFLRST